MRKILSLLLLLCLVMSFILVPAVSAGDIKGSHNDEKEKIGHEENSLVKIERLSAPMVGAPSIDEPEFTPPPFTVKVSDLTDNEDGEARFPSWSPDSKTIVFHYKADGSDNNQIYK